MRLIFPFLACVLLCPPPAAAQDGPTEPSLVPPRDLIAQEGSESELRTLIERYSEDRSALNRRYDVQPSEGRRDRLREFYTGWQHELDGVDFDALGLEGRVDYLLMANHLGKQIALLDRDARMLGEAAALLPFSGTIIGFQESRRAKDRIDQRKAAEALEDLAEQIGKIQKGVEAGQKKAAPGGEKKEDAAKPEEAAKKEEPVAPIPATKTVALRVSKTAQQLQRTMKNWYDYYAGYDPLFSWWAAAPYKKADRALKDYITYLREKICGFKKGEDDPIIGDPIGREELLKDLKYEMITYTPEELVKIANKEFAWCEAEMKKASIEMGYGDDWKAALEQVKTLHVAPGEQPELIRELADEATAFVEDHDLVTVPPLAKEIWRIEMMSPERQKVSPFFLGGEVILVSFPTDSMSHEDKLMSMRGNNIHFSRATVFHELIPGHHLQGFMNDRYHPYRGRVSGTPFWTEGWALYWEMLLWDMDFPKSPENRVGMLFWRMHRCARIIFSLGFHLGDMTPQECVDFLVDRVGHERANAEAEVRRSFEGSYPPLYQIAYMIGGLQFRALHREFVESGRMTDRAFHDAILHENAMPVEMVKVLLEGRLPQKDFTPSWRFYPGF